MTCLDLHTHHPGRPHSILSAPPAEAMALANDSTSAQDYSLQLHPWHVDAAMVEAFRQAVQVCRDDPHLVAIGECGIDPHSAADRESQLAAFRLALDTARTLHLPVIVHCVQAWDDLLRLRKEYPEVPFIVHGFRKGPALAQQLLAHGIDISLGEKYNPDVAALVPDGRLHFETDESDANICEIRKKILSLRP